MAPEQRIRGAMTVLRSAVLAMLLLPLATPVCAQWSPDLRAGARVRLRLPETEYQDMGHRGQRIRGTVAHLAPDTLFLRLGDSVGTVAIPRALIRRLDVSRGVPSRVSSAIRTGVIWGIVVGVTTALYPESEPTSLSHTEQAAIGAGVGLSIGAVFGAIYPIERWKRLRLEPGLGYTNGDALNMSIRISW